jgi:hypothetical protein
MRIRVLNFLAAFHLTLTYMDVGAAEVKWVLVVRRLTPHRVTLRIRPATWCSGREACAGPRDRDRLLDAASW